MQNARVGSVEAERGAQALSDEALTARAWDAFDQVAKAQAPEVLGRAA